MRHITNQREGEGLESYYKKRRGIDDKKGIREIARNVQRQDGKKIS